jgi:hypothetical protein
LCGIIWEIHKCPILHQQYTDAFNTSVKMVALSLLVIIMWGSWLNNIFNDGAICSDVSSAKGW